MFKDMRELMKASKEIERPSLRETLSQASQAVKSVQQSQAQAQVLMASGSDAVATLRGLRDTGTYVNEQPVMDLDLSVDVGGFASDVTHRQVVPHALLPQLQIGARLAAKVDPSDHSKLLVTGVAAS
jgi:hypothetical protein